MKVGDRFDFPDEHIHGYVSDVICDVHGEPASIVVRMDDGQWAAVPLDQIQPCKVTLQ